jgi:hypothetical protein
LRDRPIGDWCRPTGPLHPGTAGWSRLPKSARLALWGHPPRARFPDGGEQRNSVPAGTDADCTCC